MSVVVGAKLFDAVHEEAAARDSKGNAGGPPDADAGEDEAHAREKILAALPTALDELRKVDRGNGVLAIPDNQLASLLQSFVSEQADSRLGKPDGTGQLRPLTAGGYEVKFDTHDVAGWVLDYMPAWIVGRFKKRPWVDPSEEVVTIPDDARVALVGDWGSGMYGAPVCARSILEQRAKPYDVVMHLGDVYYAGTTTEVRDRFLAMWPRVPKARHRALNSNHEMYSGGEGYFGLTLQDPAFADQKSSCFAMQTSKFLLLGLDSAYIDGDLDPKQVAWIVRRVGNARGRKVVLFSHHQPISAFESQGDKLQEKLRALLEGRQIFAWYWGHEHRCVVFDRHEKWNLSGRCIGHSGYPSFRDHFTRAPQRQNGDGSVWYPVESGLAPPARVLDGPNPYVKGQEREYAPNGYASLDFDGDKLHETILAPDDAVLMTGTLA
jgi:hypothetical protein